MPFPGDQDRCERCGYALTGLEPQGACPECGEPLARSHPGARPGLPWQQRRGAGPWLQTALAVGLRPRTSFRRMRVKGEPLIDLCFPASIVLILGTAWVLLLALAALPRPLLTGFLAGGAVAALSGLDAAGAGLMALWRGDPNPFAKAWRVAAYASAGWIPGGLLLGKLAVLFAHDELGAWWPWAASGIDPTLEIALLLLGLLAAILPFEILVFVGMRRVRFANG